MAGTPGTGLGGIFYGLLVVWMAVRELWLLAIGASHRARWTKIFCLGNLLAGIVLALWLEGWLLQQLVDRLPQLEAEARLTRAAHSLAPALTFASFAVLAALLIGVRVAGWLLPPSVQAPSRRARIEPVTGLEAS